jgi:phosphate uptake regulator
MLHHAGQERTFTEDAARLSEGVSGLCALVIELFKNAAAALFGPEPDPACWAIESAARCAVGARQINHDAIAMLARWNPTGDDLLTVVRLHRAATEFARIGEYGRHVAEHALALGGSVEHELRQVYGGAPDDLVTLVRQVYVVLRGCLVLGATGDGSLARRLIAEQAELERIHRALKLSLDRGLAMRPERAQQLRRLESVIGELRQVGVCAAALCEGFL